MQRRWEMEKRSLGDTRYGLCLLRSPCTWSCYTVFITDHGPFFAPDPARDVIPLIACCEPGRWVVLRRNDVLWANPVDISQVHLPNR